MLLFETIQLFDGKPKNLELHQTRMNNSFYHFFKKECEYDLEKILNMQEFDAFGKIKCRFIYDENCFKLEFLNYIPKKVNSLKLIYCDEIEYEHKYFDRSSLDELLKFKGNCDDIMIVKNGLISDSSYSNLAFFDGVKYYTPNSPLLNGTKRQLLLRDNIIFESEIKPSDLKHFKHVKLINAMLDLDDSIPIFEIC